MVRAGDGGDAIVHLLGILPEEQRCWVSESFGFPRGAYLGGAIIAGRIDRSKDRGWQQLFHYPGVPNDNLIYREFDYESILQCPSTARLIIPKPQFFFLITIPRIHIEKPNTQD